MSELLMEEIENVLDEKVRPDLALHGGNIKVVSLEHDALSLRMLGQCSGCPSANITMENIVNEALKESFPQLKEVSLVTGVSDQLMQEAREMLRRRKQ